jgi:PAS domain S-box-containing protein
MEGLGDTRAALAFLAAATDAFAQHEDLQASLDALARAVLPALGDMVFIDVVPPLGGVRFAAAAVDPEIERIGIEYRRRFGAEAGPPGGPIQRAMRGDQPVVERAFGPERQREIESDPEQASFLARLRPSSMYVVPMRLGGSVAGAMSFAFEHGSLRTPDESVVALAGEIARWVGWAIDRARRASLVDAERAEHIEALRRRREEYRALIEHSPDIVSRLDRDKRHLYVSRTVELATGLNADELLGRTFVEAGIPADLAVAWEAIVDRVFTTGRPESGVFGFETPHGFREYESRFVPELAADGSVSTVIRISRDVTAEREAARAIERANRGLHVLSRGMEEIARVGSEAELFAAICGVLAEVGGYRLAWVGFADDGPGKPVKVVARAGTDSEYADGLQISWDESIAAGRGPTGTAIRTGAPSVFRNVREDADFAPWRAAAIAHGFGSTLGLPLAVGGHVIGVLAIYATEVDAFDEDELALMARLAGALSLGIDAIRAREARDLSEAELRRREEHFRGLIENASDAILDVAADRVVRYASPAIHRILGFDPAQVAGRPVFDLLLPEARSRADAVLTAALAMPGLVHTFATVGLHRDGSQRELEIVGHSPIGEGEPRLVLHARDVSERSRLEERLRETQKVDAINRLAAGIAHDFNNVLTIIQGAASMLRIRVRDSERAREDVEEILTATDRAAALTRQLLLFSRRGPEQPKIVDVRAACADVERMLRRLIGVDVELVLSLGEDPARVRIDPGQLEQVVLNLAVNGRDAMPEGGRLSVSVERVEIATSIDSIDGPIPPGGYVRLVVADTGVGVAPEILARIFDPFFTTKPAGRGTGLGLSTVRSIVHRAGGYVRVEPATLASGVSSAERARGTRFVVHLPYVDAAVEAARAAPRRDLHGTELVLLVDDDEAVRRLSARALRAQGYEVVEACDGVEALEAFARVRERVRIVVTDLVMPHLRGQALADRLAELEPSLPVLMVSALADEISQVDLGSRRAFLAKPFAPEALLARVRDLLDQH